MHGARGGAPKGSKNALKHGRFTAEATEARRKVAALTKQVRQLVEAIGPDQSKRIVGQSE